MHIAPPPVARPCAVAAPLAFMAAAALMVSTRAIHAQTVQLKSTPVATGLNFSLSVRSAPGDPTRLFIVEQRGKIKIVDINANGTHTTRPTPFLDITSLLTTVGLEYGQLDIAFHPDYAQNGYFYVTVTPPVPSSSPDWAIWRFQVSADPNVANFNSRQSVIQVSYGISNHRAGWLAFGPDGYLYANTGDGGEQDPGNHASNLGSLRGKILRLDVDGPDNIPGNDDDDAFPADPINNYSIPPSNPFVSTPGARAELWAYGLRNPWRASFDRLTGDLWIGDVGQSAREEIDFQPGTSAGGEFYGWRCIEGTVPTNYAGCTNPLPPSVAPILDIPRTGAQVSSNSITGGHVYRGCVMPSLQGTYIFGDWTGKVWSGNKVGDSLQGIVTRTTELNPPGQTTNGSIVSFGEDAFGELYWVNWNSTNGSVYKIEPRTLQGPDCNANQKNDACDIASGFSLDANGNSVPDECEFDPCSANFDGSAEVDATDIFVFLDAWFTQNGQSGPGLSADFDGSGAVDASDIFIFLDAWFRAIGATC